jgi:TetR/AcrR family transcriptional regulator of autoinduction and epiphytic fitness
MARKEEITTKIVQASIEEFMAKGLNSASMENIAKLALVSKRTLYKYFSNKDEIFDVIVSELLESFCQYANFNYKKDLPIAEQLQNIVNTKIELITSDENMKLSKLVISELLKSKKLNDQHLLKFNESEQRFVKWIDDAKKDNKVTSIQSSELIANQFHSIIKGQIFYPVLFGLTTLTDEEIQIAKQTSMKFFLETFCH